MTARPNPWFRLSMDAWTLGIEAWEVIGLRTVKIAAGGPGAQAEAQRMVNEKIAAGISLQAKAMSGGLGMTAECATAGALTHYRRKVRANRRRLSK